MIIVTHLIQGRYNKTSLGVEPLTLRSWLSQKQRSEPMRLAADSQGWQYGTVRYASTVRYAPFFGKKYGTLVRYVIIAKVRVRYVGTCYKYAY